MFVIIKQENIFEGVIKHDYKIISEKKYLEKLNNKSFILTPNSLWDMFFLTSTNNYLIQNNRNVLTAPIKKQYGISFHNITAFHNALKFSYCVFKTKTKAKLFIDEIVKPMAVLNHLSKCVKI